MQIFSVLRGCVAAYIVGVLFNWAGYLIDIRHRPRPAGDIWTDLVFMAVMGGGLALIATILVLALWFVLARRGATVSYRDALTTGAAGTVLVFWLVGNLLPWLLVGVLLGAAFGAAFWLTAFGRRREVTLSLT